MVSISFAYPYFLFLLLLVPILVLVYFFSMLYNKKKAVLFSNFKALEKISDVEIFSKGFINLYLIITIVCLLVFALAGTSVVFVADSSSYSYVIMIDNSQSMGAKDFSPNRFEAGKLAANEFVDILPIGTKIGVIQFSGTTNVLKTLDGSKLTTKMAIDSSDFGDTGSNLYEALISSNKLLEGESMKSVLLISDGQMNVEDMQVIYDYALKNRIVINTLLVGTLEGGVTELNVTSVGNFGVMNDLAFNTEGSSFKLDPSGGFDKPLSNIIEKTQKQVRIDIFIYLLFIALLLLLIYWIMYNFRFRMLP